MPSPDPSLTLTGFQTYAAHYASWFGDLASLSFVAVVTALGLVLFASGVVAMTTLLARR